MWPFRKPKEEQPVVVLTIGDKWELFDKGDPFPSKYPPVTILEIKDGWVRYSMGKVFFNDERKTIYSFVSIYRKVK